MAIIEKVKNFYKTKRILFFVVIFVWLILTILSGILIGLYSNSKVIYLSPEEDGDLIQVYYAGTQDDWGNIFTEYKRTKVEDSEFGEEMGQSIADKLNEMMGSKYDSSEFEYYFSASPDDLKTK